MSERPEHTLRSPTISPTSADADLRRRLLELLAQPVDRPRMTYEEFLAWADDPRPDRGLAEWVDGEVVIPGFWLRGQWLWDDPLPSMLRVLAESVGMDPSVLASFERGLAGQRDDHA